MIVGLGNPGLQYSFTRHNIGFMVLDALADHLGAGNWAQDRSQADILKIRWGNHPLFLVKPLSYMNKSGVPVQKIASYYKIPFSDMMVVHDDMDLEFGQLKIVVSRGAGGHNGIRSIMGVCGTKDFIRLRIGLGRPSEIRKDVTAHVLGKFSPREQAMLDQVIENSLSACELILSNGLTHAMNRVNARNFPQT